MSRILNKICKEVAENKKKSIFAMAIAVLMVISFFVQFYILSVLMAAGLVCVFLNEAVVRRNRKQRQPFWSRSGIRNIDMLIIGEPCVITEYVRGGYSYVALTAPGRTLSSSYEILRHTFSILTENSPTVVITVKKKNIEGGFSGFDIPIFKLSPITVKKLKLESLERKERFLLIFYPIRSIEKLLNIKKKFSEPMINIPQEILDFCEERNLNLKIFVR